MHPATRSTLRTPLTDDLCTGRVRYESGGDLYDIAIVDNQILRHGANGIAVVRFFGLPSLNNSARQGIVLVTVHGLHIASNTIENCLRRAVAQSKSAIRLFLGYGGISLAFVTELVIEGNLVQGNGRDWLSPVSGIFALAVDGMRIEHNQIRANGRRNGEPVDGAQPGIVPASMSGWR